MKEAEEILARLVELIKDDPPLHDAIVRWITAMAETEEAKTQLTVRRMAKLDERKG